MSKFKLPSSHGRMDDHLGVASRSAGHVIRTACFGSAALVAATSAHAQDSAPVDPYRDSVTVGAVGVYLPDYEGSGDYRTVPAPVAIGSVRGYAFVLSGNQFGVDLLKNAPGPVWDLQAGPIVNVNFNRSSPSDIRNLQVGALGKRDVAIELGGFVGIGKTGVITSPYDKLSLSLSYRHDVSDVHDSGILQPSLVYFTPLSTKAALGLYASAEIVEKGYARTYYGVTAAESVASGLRRYDAKGGLKNWNVGVVGSYSLTGDLLHGVKFVASGSYGRVVGSISRSPLVQDVGSRDQWLGAAGLAFTF